jgi:hypothetical protein
VIFTLKGKLAGTATVTIKDSNGGSATVRSPLQDHEPVALFVVRFKRQRTNEAFLVRTSWRFLDFWHGP